MPNPAGLSNNQYNLTYLTYGNKHTNKELPTLLSFIHFYVQLGTYSTIIIIGMAVFKLVKGPATFILRYYTYTFIPKSDCSSIIVCEAVSLLQIMLRSNHFFRV